MDPEHATCFAQAQVELRELFLELECNGQVGDVELQRSLVPFTAGDVRRDLLELVDELRRKRQCLDETEFLRVMWRKMYLSSAVDATKSAGRGQPKPINVSLAHVIISVKRRRQLKQFASYYASRGISGADHLTSPTKSATGNKSAGISPTQLHQQVGRAPSPTAVDSLESIATLRRRYSPSFDVVACVYDPERLEMRSRVVMARARSAEVRNCSRLYCLLFAKEAGSFVLGSTYFGKNALRNHEQEKEELGVEPEADSEASLYCSVSLVDRDEMGLLMIRMEELGLRNIVTAASNHTSFAASTGRKLHQWRAVEPFRVFEEEEASAIETNYEGDGNSDPMLQAASSIATLDADPPGDSFGLLGGKPLIARTKTIADVGDLRQIAAGDNFFMAVSSSGGLFSWESCQSATPSTMPPLGRGNTIPERVPWFSQPEKVFRVACGDHHVLALTSSGIYAWGLNLYGQLGLGTHCSVLDPHAPEPAPVRLPANDVQVLDIACGDSHSVVLLESGQVFTFGCNWEGQLGIDEPAIADTGCSYEPLPVKLPRTCEEAAKVYLITAGPQSTAVVATTGQVFQWGKCVRTGVNGVCGRVSCWIPEELEVASAECEAKPGPVWHSIGMADGLVVLTRHATATSSPAMD